MDNVKEIPTRTPQVLTAMVMWRFETPFLRQRVDLYVCERNSNSNTTGSHSNGDVEI